ncbi:hypothetical protein E3P99_00373 [Wallemia hederae]|uniref:MICOS complex subunit MIC19 n=1 Tax=Wallemia hederae TaxID=1540922 RepID=A0A4T0G0Q6_9BASI|nr:hypothetical protein E3P99_00373 [Wallemia hederae]
MGNQSSTQQQQQQFNASETTPIHFSNSLINDLSDQLKSDTQQPDQITIDEQIRNRIHKELKRLRDEEHSVRLQIENALAQDNAEKSKSKDNSILSSDSVKRSIDDIKQKIDRHHDKKDINKLPAIKSTQNELVKCFKDNQDTPLNCYIQTESFKQAVADAEKTMIASLK